MSEMGFIDFEQMQQILGELCDELPPEFFEDLNLGVVLKSEVEFHHDSRPENPLYVMGLYVRNSMGRQIFIFYGSFRAVYQGAPEEVIRQQLRHTLRHEFTHHLEYLAGEKGLELDDKRRLEQYLRN